MSVEGMIVAGFGFRGAATVESLRDALARTGMAADVTALATLEDKADKHVFIQFSKGLSLPVYSVSQEAVAQVETPTDSAVVRAHRQTGSVAEAAALATHPEARLLCERVISKDRMASCAIAKAPNDPLKVPHEMPETGDPA